MIMVTYINAFTVYGIRSILQATLVVHIIHDTRWQHWENEVMLTWFIIQAVTPLTTGDNIINTYINYFAMF